MRLLALGLGVLSWSACFFSPDGIYRCDPLVETCPGAATDAGGGVDAGAPDVSAWQRLSPATAPPALPDVALAWDAARRVMVLVGGTPGTTRPVSTWEWDGGAWAQQVTNSGPSAQKPQAVAFDRRRQRTVVFGPTTLSDFFPPLWEWDGAAWVRTPIATPPSGVGPLELWSSAMTYDLARGQIVVFGGVVTALSVTGEAPTDDHWTLTWGTASQPFCARQSGPPAPTPRFGHAMVYDSKRDVTVLFGGTNGATSFGDTWEWDGHAWAARTSTSPPPPARFGHALAFDSLRNRVVLFGGTSNGALLNDTWEWDGQAWSARHPTTAPTMRTGHAMAFDEARGQVLLFGGSDGTDTLAETWVFDSAGP